MKIRNSFFLSLAVLTLLAPGLFAQQLNPKLEKKEKTIKNVLILPAKVELVKSGMKGGEGMLKESDQVAVELPKLVVAALQKKGYTVLDDPFTTSVLDDHSDLKFALADIQSRYDVLGKQLWRKPKDVKKGRFTLGDEVSKVNPDGRADTLIFIRAVGQKNTGGKKALGVALMNPFFLMDVMLVSISVVDAQSGEVLATAQTVGTGDFVGKTERSLAKRIEKSLNKLPAPK